MPVYEFLRKRGGRQEIIEANLSFGELEVYNLLSRALGGKSWHGSEATDDNGKLSLYSIISEETSKDYSEKKDAPSWEEFKQAYERLEREGILGYEDGGLSVLPRKYSSTPVFFHGPGFYSTDNRKGNGGSGDNGGRKGNKKR